MVIVFSVAQSAAEIYFNTGIIIVTNPAAPGDGAIIHNKVLNLINLHNLLMSHLYLFI